MASEEEDMFIITFDKKKQYKKHKTSIKKSTWTNSGYSVTLSWHKQHYNIRTQDDALIEIF